MSVAIKSLFPDKVDLWQVVNSQPIPCTCSKLCVSTLIKLYGEVHMWYNRTWRRNSLSVTHSVQLLDQGTLRKLLLRVSMGWSANPRKTRGLVTAWFSGRIAQYICPFGVYIVYVLQNILHQMVHVMMYQYSHTRALNGGDSGAWRGLIWGQSVTCCYTHSGRWHYPPISHFIDMYHGCTHKGLPETPDNLKPLVLSYIHFCM